MPLSNYNESPIGSTGSSSGLAYSPVTPPVPKKQFGVTEVDNGFTMHLYNYPQKTFVAADLESLINVIRTYMSETTQDPASTDTPQVSEESQHSGAATELDHTDSTNQPAA